MKINNSWNVKKFFFFFFFFFFLNNVVTNSQHIIICTIIVPVNDLLAIGRQCCLCPVTDLIDTVGNNINIKYLILMVKHIIRFCYQCRSVFDAIILHI